MNREYEQVLIFKNTFFIEYLRSTASALACDGLNAANLCLSPTNNFHENFFLVFW